MVLTKCRVDFYDGILPGPFPAEGWNFDDVRSIASFDRRTLGEIAKKVWEEDSTKYDFSAILLADINKIERDGVIIYYGSSIGCSAIL